MAERTAERAVVKQWRDVLACHASVSSALEHELGLKHALGVSEFEVLERLAEGPDDCEGLRVQELADDVYLSQSALSRLIGRLESAGLVARTICAADRRGIFVNLTDAGRERYLAARPTHRAVLKASLPR